MKNKPLPIVAIPTTAGTGTEVDAWTVVTNEATNEKMSGGNKTTFPVLSIVDPDFMLSVPPQVHRLPGGLTPSSTPPSPTSTRTRT